MILHREYDQVDIMTGQCGSGATTGFEDGDIKQGIIHAK